MHKIRNAAKKIIGKELYTDYYYDHINDSIVLYVPFNSVSAVKAGKTKARLKEGKAVLPFTEKLLKNLNKKGIKLNAKKGPLSFSVSIPGKNITMKNEGADLNGSTYLYSFNKMLLLKSFNYYQRELSFSYEDVLGNSAPDTFIITDSSFEVLYSIEPEGTERSVAISLKDSDLMAMKRNLQIFAVCESELIPLIVENQVLNSYLYVNCSQNRVCISFAEPESSKFIAEKSLESVRPVYSENEQIIFEVNNIGQPEVEITAKSKIPTRLSFYWKNILSGEEQKAGDFIINDTVSMQLTPFLDAERKPFERAVLMYLPEDGGGKSEKNYVYIKSSNNLLKKGETLADNSKNRIIRDVTGLIVLESNSCFTEFEEKYTYDFTRSSFKAEIEDINFEGTTVTAKFKVQSLLLPITSIAIMGKDPSIGDCFNIAEITPEKSQTLIRETIKLDLEEKPKAFINDGIRLTLMAGVQYTGGYAELGSLSVAPEGFGNQEYQAVSKAWGKAIIKIVPENDCSLTLIINA